MLTVTLNQTWHKFSFVMFRYLIMLDCWKNIPEHRPDFAELKRVIKDMGEREDRVRHLRHICVTLEHYNKFGFSWLQSELCCALDGGLLLQE